MTTREEFEAWFDKEYSAARNHQLPALIEELREVKWVVWQAAYATALDEAAKEVVKLADEAREDMALEDDYRFGVYAKKYDKAACHIRALKD